MSTASLTTQSHQVSRKLWVFLQQKLDQMQYRMSLVQYYTQVIKEIPKIPKDCKGCSSDSKSERGERIEKSRLANKFPLGYQPKSNCFEIQAQRRVNLSHFHQQLLLGHTKTEEGAQGSEIIIVRLSLASRHGIQSQYSVFFPTFLLHSRQNSQRCVMLETCHFILHFHIMFASILWIFRLTSLCKKG